MFVSTTKLNMSTAECCNRTIHSLASLSLEQSTCLHLDILIDSLVDTAESNIRQVVHLSRGDSHSSVAQAYPRSLPRAQSKIRYCLTKTFNCGSKPCRGTASGVLSVSISDHLLSHSLSLSSQINHCKCINDMPLRAVYICKIMMNNNECGNQCNRITPGPISLSSAAASRQVGHQHCQLLPYA
jgi:hypothetical protein